jgi:hypothetical protein
MPFKIFLFQLITWHQVNFIFPNLINFNDPNFILSLFFLLHPILNAFMITNLIVMILKSLFHQLINLDIINYIKGPYLLKDLGF